ncbi:MAG: sugar ABC transporter ATP-binding protein [Actinobacteria bacterium]|nr:sugar ABC transporter ATP-binding protein [Actinomycetota bacterium]
MLAIRGLSKRYPGVVAVDDVSFEVAPGEIIGLLGKNGAGKSTLIKMIGGAEQPDEGEIEIGGEVVSIGNPRDATGLGISVVHQELADVPSLSVAENVELGLGYPTLGGAFVNWRKLRGSAKRALDQIGAEIDPAAPLSSLSVAEQRLVMIARSLSTELRILILDEPSASLTEPEVERLLEVVRTLSAQGVAVLYVTHRLAEVFAVSHRVVVMRDSRFVGARPTAELDRSTLIEMITGPALTKQAPVSHRRARAAADGDAPELLRVEGVSRRGVVEDVSFGIRAGEVVGLAGLVGSGRTELTRLIFGADKRSAGRIFVAGEEVRIRSPRDALRNGIVLLPEDRRHQGAVGEFTIRENVTLPTLDQNRTVALLPRPSRRKEREVAGRYVERLAIRGSGVEHPVRLLSGGNQQKVVLAKWLEHGARIFFFDEPTLGVDVEGKQDAYESMDRLAAEGSAVLFISSEFGELLTVCDRILVMAEGRLVGELANDGLGERDIIDACYENQKSHV